MGWRVLNDWGKRRLNKVSWKVNPNGEYYVFGVVGTGKNSTIVTLAYRKTRGAISLAYKKFERHLGELMNEVPRE